MPTHTHALALPHGQACSLPNERSFSSDSTKVSITWCPIPTQRFVACSKWLSSPFGLLVSLTRGVCHIGAQHTISTHPCSSRSHLCQLLCSRSEAYSPHPSHMAASTLWCLQACLCGTGSLRSPGQRDRHHRPGSDCCALRSKTCLKPRAVPRIVPEQIICLWATLTIPASPQQPSIHSVL